MAITQLSIYKTIGSFIRTISIKLMVNISVLIIHLSLYLPLFTNLLPKMFANTFSSSIIAIIDDTASKDKLLMYKYSGIIVSIVI